MEPTERSKAIKELALFIVYAGIEYNRASYAGMVNSPARNEALEELQQEAVKKVTAFADALTSRA